MITKTYLIKLTPLQRFFFGGEINHLDPSYYIPSIYYPQQSGLIGFLRHQLLIQNGLIENGKTDWNNAAQLIGKDSYRIENRHFNMGAIKKISNLFLMDDNKQLQLSALDNGLQPKFINGQSHYLQQQNNVPIYENYDPKKYLNLHWGDYNEDEIFINDENPGIDKKAEDKGYIKMSWKRFRRNSFAFAFYATLDEKWENADKEEKAVLFTHRNPVTFGKEQSVFKMEVEPVLDPKSITDTDTVAKKIILQSDAFVEQDFFNQVIFCCGEVANYRTVFTSNVTGNMFNIQINETNRSQNWKLLKKGSTVYLKEKNKIHIILNQHSYLTNAGFNQYITD